MKKVFLLFLSLCLFINTDFFVISKELKKKEDNTIEFTTTNQIEKIDFGENIKVEIDNDGIISIKDMPKINISDPANNETTQNSIKKKNDDDSAQNKDKWVLLLKADKKPYKNNKQDEFDIFDEINKKETKIPSYKSNDLYNVYYETDKEFILSDDLSKNELQYDLKKIPHQNLKSFYIVLAKYIEKVTVAKEKDEESNDKNIDVDAYFYYGISKTSYELPIKVLYESNIENEPYKTDSNKDKSYEYLKKTDNLSTNIPTQNKYKFDSWYTDSKYENLVKDLKTEYENFAFNKDTTLFELKLYAKWVEKTTPKWITKPVINSFTYGTNAPAITYQSETPNSYISVSYNGTTASGAKYNGAAFPKLAGNYDAVFSIKESPNYKSLTTKIPFEILKKEVNLVWNNTKQTYTGKKLLPTVTLNGVLDGDNCSCSVNIREGESINVGTYTAEAINIDNLNYSLPAKNSVPFQIIKKTTIKKINLAEVDKFNSKSYKNNKNSSDDSNLFGNNIVKDDITIDSAASSDNKTTLRSNPIKYIRDFISENKDSIVKKSITYTVLLTILYILDLIINLIIGSICLLYSRKRKRVVRFETNGGSEIKRMKVKKGEQISRPENPTKENAIFDAWYTDKNCLIKYDFDSKNYKDIKLFANWS